MNGMDKKTLGLIGHPYVPIGMGEHLRSTFRSLRSVAARPEITDIYKLTEPNPEESAEFSHACTNRPCDINLFHINGQEVEQAMAHLTYSQPWSGYKVIYPLWELPNYPGEWARLLDRFDEIWAPSRFIQESIAAACEKPVLHMPLACEVRLSSFLGRRYFGIPETPYTFLFFFDMRSYAARKNPGAVIGAFRALLAKHPFADAHLVIKVNGAELNPDAFLQLKTELEEMKGYVTIFHRLMASNEVKNLIRSCDCFVSLHRSEGYGFGIAEAMFLGKPVIATAWSGNMDFMPGDASLGVGYELVPVAEGAYPHWENQVWADPDIDQAARYMEQLVEDPAFGYALGRRASSHIRAHFSYRAAGNRYIVRLDEIQGLLG